MFNEYRLLEKTAELLKKYFYIPLIISCGYIAIIILFNLYIEYCSFYYFPLALSVLLSVMGLSHYLQNVKVIRYLGEVSFSIYLLHMPIAGIIANLTRRLSSFVLVPFAPILCLAITAFGIWIYTIIIRYIRIEKWAGMLIGLRPPKKVFNKEETAKEK